MADSELKVRQCANCGTTLTRCYDVSNPWAMPRMIKCCPDCDHRAPTPPSTVKVEMSVEDARVWKDISAIANWQQLARLQEAARAALRAEGLD